MGIVYEDGLCLVRHEHSQDVECKSLTLLNLCSVLVQASMKVCAMTDKEASTTSWTWTSKMKWGFFSMFTQNLRGRLQSKEKDKKSFSHSKCSTTSRSHEIKYRFLILISSQQWSLILYFNIYTSYLLSGFHVWKSSLYISHRKTHTRRISSSQNSKRRCLCG